MNPERWRQIERIYHAALDTGPIVATRSWLLVRPERAHSETGIVRAGIDVHAAGIPGFTYSRAISERLKPCSFVSNP